MKTPTPRTDTEFGKGYANWTETSKRLLAFAKKLEIELAESNDKWAELFGKVSQAHDRANKAKAELIEVKKALEVERGWVASLSRDNGLLIEAADKTKAGAKCIDLHGRNEKLTDDISRLRAEVERLKGHLAGTPASHVEAVFQLAKELGQSHFDSKPPIEFVRSEIQRLEDNLDEAKRAEDAVITCHRKDLTRIDELERDAATLCEIIDHASPNAWDNGNTHPDGHGPDEGSILMSRLYSPLREKYAR